MLLLSFFMLLTIQSTFSYYVKNKYCKISQEHTMCIYSGIGSACKNPGDYGVTNAHKREILRVHNRLRSKVASGKETRGIGGPQPPAANMLEMSWDDELASIAQRWADQCTNKDDVRDVERWSVGQNILQRKKHAVDWTYAITSWYEGVNYFDTKAIPEYEIDERSKYYSQLVWHYTNKIGCGRRDWGAYKIYVCNYGPIGNLEGDPVYKIGQPCSKCPSDLICVNSLCGSARKRVDLTDETKNATKLSRKRQTDGQISKNDNATYFVILDIDGHTYIKPLNALDSLYNLTLNTSNLIEEGKLKLNENEKIILENIKNKIKELLESVGKGKPTVETKPTVDTKPTVETKPTVDTKPTVNTKPKVDTKPTVDTKPKVEAKPKFEEKATVKEKTLCN